MESRRFDTEEYVRRWKEMMSYDCEKCGRKWALSIGGDGKIYPNTKPFGRSAGRCYCGTKLGGGD